MPENPHNPEFEEWYGLLVQQIALLYDGKYRLTEALPEMADNVVSAELREALRGYFITTQSQIARFDSAFADVRRESCRITSYAMRGLVEECRWVLELNENAHVKDAALVSVARRIVAGDIAACQGAQALAVRLKHYRTCAILRRATTAEMNYGIFLAYVQLSINP